MQITKYFLHWVKKKNTLENENPLGMSHWFYRFPFCFAEISAEEISACVGWSIGLTVRESQLYLGASVSSSDCVKKGFLKTGMIAGQMSVKASCVTSWGHLGMEIQVRSHKGMKKGALVPSLAMAHTQSWDQNDFGSKPPGVLTALEKAGIKAAIPGLEMRK